MEYCYGLTLGQISLLFENGYRSMVVLESSRKPQIPCYRDRHPRQDATGGSVYPQRNYRWVAFIPPNHLPLSTRFVHSTNRRPNTDSGVKIPPFLYALFVPPLVLSDSQLYSPQILSVCESISFSIESFTTLLLTICLHKK